MVTKVEAYRADDGSLHKTELDAHEQNVRSLIKEMDPDGDSFMHSAVHILWRERRRIFNVLKRVPGIE